MKFDKKFSEEIDLKVAPRSLTFDTTRYEFKCPAATFTNWASFFIDSSNQMCSEMCHDVFFGSVWPQTSVGGYARALLDYENRNLHVIA